VPCQGILLGWTSAWSLSPVPPIPPTSRDPGTGLTLLLSPSISLSSWS
jgi:hypothetical protein